MLSFVSLKVVSPAGISAGPSNAKSLAVTVTTAGDGSPDWAVFAAVSAAAFSFPAQAASDKIDRVVRSETVNERT